MPENLLSYDNNDEEASDLVVVTTPDAAVVDNKEEEHEAVDEEAVDEEDGTGVEKPEIVEDHYNNKGQLMFGVKYHGSSVRGTFFYTEMDASVCVDVAPLVEEYKQMHGL